jgi:hypothetical protein
MFDFPLPLPFRNRSPQNNWLNDSGAIWHGMVWSIVDHFFLHSASGLCAYFFSDALAVRAVKAVHRLCYIQAFSLVCEWGLGCVHQGDGLCHAYCLVAWYSDKG